MSNILFLGINGWQAAAIVVLIAGIAFATLGITANWRKIVVDVLVLRPAAWLKFRYVQVLAILIGIAFAALFVQFILSLLFAPDSTDARNYALILAALLGAPFVIWRAFVAQKQVNIAHEGHMTDRINKAVEQLGAEKTVKQHRKNRKGKEQFAKGKGDKLDYKKPIITETTEPNLEVRLGAIYALERIAQDSIRDHISVMEILCAYVRNNAPAEKAEKIEVDTNTDNWKEKLNSDIAKIPPPPIDIQAVLSVIGRRKASHITFEQDAHNNPHKRAYVLDLRKTNLQGLHLSDLKLGNAQFEGTQMQGAKLWRAHLQAANLWSAQLQGADMMYANIEWASFWRANMRGAKLAYVKMTAADLGGTEMQGINLRDAEMQRASLMGARMQGAHLEGAKMQRADLSLVNAKGAIFSNAQMQGVNLQGAEMQGAWLIGAEMDQSTVLSVRNFSTTAVRSVDLSKTTKLSEKHINSMFGDCTTKLPEGIKKPNWAEWECNSTEFHNKWQTAKKAAGL